MNDNRDRRYLSYVSDVITLIERRTHGDRDTFLSDIDIQDAVLWRMETLAEATGKLSANFNKCHPEIRWRAIYGFRNIAAHGYLDLHLDVVWEIIEQHLSSLKAVVDQELNRLTDGGARPSAS